MSLVGKLAVLAVAVLAIGGPSPASGASDGEARCRNTLARESGRLFRSRLLRECEVRDTTGASGCDDDRRDAERLGGVEARFHRAVARACGGRDRVCGAGDDDTPLAAIGWGSGACPGALGSSCTMAVDDCDDVASCIACLADEALTGSLEMASSIAGDVGGERRDSCRRRTVRAVSRYFAERSDLVQRCVATPGCNVASVDAEMQIAEGRLQRTICLACGDRDGSCDRLSFPGSARRDDAATRPATCPDVTPPGSTESCAGPLASVGDAASCLACTTRHRSDCAALAASPSSGPLPRECWSGPICDTGYEGLRCDRLRPEVVPSLAELPDPVLWETDGETGLRYRRATAWERRRHRWAPGTFLVETAGLREAASRGESSLDVSIPVADGEVHRFEFPLASSSSGQEMIEVSVKQGEALASRSTPRFFEYLSRPAADAPLDGLLRILSVQDGGAAIVGVVAGYRVDGFVPTGPLELDPGLATPPNVNPAGIAPVTVFVADSDTAQGWNDCHGLGICGAFCDNQGITAPCSGDAYNPCCAPFDPDGGPGDECHDGFDNDYDGKVDAAGIDADNLCVHSQYCLPGGSKPFHTHKHESGMQFILFGDVHYCTDLIADQKDWRVEMHARAQSIVEGLALATGHAGFDVLTARQKARMISAKCWVLPTTAQARDCKDLGGNHCAPFDVAPHVYPYAGDGNNSLNYINTDHQALDLAHSVDVGLTNPANMTQVIMATAVGELLTGTISPIVLGNTTGAYSVVQASDTSSRVINLAVSNHEFGHSLGLGHCTGDYSPIDGVCTVMADEDSSGGNGCIYYAPCNPPDGNRRFSPASAAEAYGTLCFGTGLPYQFGNIP